MGDELTEVEMRRLFRARRTVCKLLRNRKYVVDEAEIDMDYDVFKERYGNPTVKTNLTMLVGKLDDVDEKLFVFFPEEPKVGVKPIRRYLDEMKRESVKRAIILVQDSMTPFAKQALNELAPQYVLEQFAEAELLVDITEHELVPKHEVLSADEKAALLAQYKLSETQLPRMKPTDPIARYFGLQRGDTVKIVRSSETAGRYVTYRVVL